MTSLTRLLRVMIWGPNGDVETLSSTPLHGEPIRIANAYSFKLMSGCNLCLFIATCFISLLCLLSFPSHLSNPGIASHHVYTHAFPFILPLPPRSSLPFEAMLRRALTLYLPRSFFLQHKISTVHALG